MKLILMEQLFDEKDLETGEVWINPETVCYVEKCILEFPVVKSKSKKVTAFQVHFSNGNSVYTKTDPMNLATAGNEPV